MEGSNAGAGRERVVPVGKVGGVAVTGRRGVGTGAVAVAGVAALGCDLADFLGGAAQVLANLTNAEIYPSLRTERGNGHVRKEDAYRFWKLPGFRLPVGEMTSSGPWLAWPPLDAIA